MSQLPSSQRPSSPELLPDSDPPSPVNPDSDLLSDNLFHPEAPTLANSDADPSSLSSANFDPTSNSLSSSYLGSDPSTVSQVNRDSDSEFRFQQPARATNIETGDALDRSSVTTIAPWAQRGSSEHESTQFGNPRILADSAPPRSRLVESDPQLSSPSTEDAGASRDSAGDSTQSNAIELLTEDSNSPLTSRQCDEPPAKIRKISSPKLASPKSPEETDGETCPICLDSWGNSGEHRLVALKCGHLFGDECVQRWLKAQPVRNRCCPTCKSKANVRDLRFIYARRLVAADTSQLTSLQKQIETLQAEKNRTELELQKSKISHKAATMQLEILRSLMKSQTNKDQPVRKSWRFALEKNLEICKDGGCRVLTYNCRTYELYVSQKSGNYLFPGYGIRKISSLDYKLGQFVYLHPKPIRDITYSQPRDLLLSVGLDSSARIVERGIPSVTVNTNIPLWSCSWDYLRSNDFYVGGVGGIIQQYDVRNPSNCLQTLTAPGDLSPVVSLCSTEFGLLSCQLNSCWLWVGNNKPLEPRALPIEGSFTSLCYDNEAHRALISTRPSANGAERSKLTLCKLKGSNLSGEVLFDIEETFNGSARSSLMSRPCWVKVPGASWVAAHSESDSTLYLHGLDGARTMSLPAAEPALDVGCVEQTGNTILASLSASRLRIYKAVPT